MDYHQYTSSRNTPTYPSYTSTSGTNYFNSTNAMTVDPYYTDSYGRSVASPSSAVFRTATIKTNSPSTPTPIATARVQQFSHRPSKSNNNYDIPRNFNTTISSGYLSDSNDLRCSSISVRPGSAIATSSRPIINQQSYLTPSATAYTSRISSNNDQNYYSDSEYVSSGPRYYKISREINTSRRPSNVALPIRSVTSKAYDQYVPPEQPVSQQQLFDVYRYQQEQQRLEREREREQRERERQEQLQRQLYQQQQAAAVAAARFNPPPKLTLPSQATINHEIGAELYKSPIANSKL